MDGLQVEIEHDLRAFPERERSQRQEEMLPIVNEFTATDTGRRYLAAVLFSYLRDRHISAPGSSAERTEEDRAAAAEPEREAQAENVPERKRRRRRRRRPKEGE